jgi:hypothetical protein
MKKLLFGLLILLTSCSKEIVTPDVPKPKLSLSIDPLLPIDSNGYYHFKLFNRNPLGNNLHKFSGKMLIDNNPPPVGEPVIVEYECSHYGMLPKGGVIITGKKSYINTFTGMWTTVILPSNIAMADYVFPIITSSCYVNRQTGDINGVVEPTYEMRGDTMLIAAKSVYRWVTKRDGVWETGWAKDSVIDIKKIILE